ncbi:hypothetical protein ACIRP3_00880 [Streptomyces sp. NPDC101209]|uniref:hypothetical protein n=1 Tax=Streptomyces sp. NPDC101209 TaxID=3366129 RepID=UPI00382BEC00
MAEREVPASVSELMDRVQNDPVMRARLISRFSDALIDLGVRPEDIHLVSGLENILPLAEEREAETMEAGEVAIVFISKSDTKKNTESIIVG